jgi:hypothetical protein
VSDLMGVGLQRWLNVLRLSRIGSLLLIVGSWYAYLRGNDREALAIFRAGGDAGLWGLGIFLVTAAVVPGIILLLLSLFRPWTRFSAVTAITAGCLCLVIAAWLGPSLYPPEKVTSDGFVLNTHRWEQVAESYLAFLVLLGVAGLLALLGGLATLRLRSAGHTSSDRATS